MSKGLKVTLLMVAIALIGYRAMAEAPVIDEIPDVIIADDVPITGSATLGGFVYPDAIDLDKYVTDDATADADIKWSFFVDTSEDTTVYTLNGQASLTQAEVDGATVQNNPGAKSITAVATGEADEDTNARTVTFRNESATPLGGGDPTVTYTEDGFVNSKVVSLFASDGTTWTQADLMVYTEKNGTKGDRLSPEGPTPELVKDIVFPSAENVFVSKNEFPSLGTVTFTSSSSIGLCIQVGAADTNVGTWTSDYGLIELTGNTVYRLRVKMTSDQTTAGLNPLWDIVIDNYGTVTGGGTTTHGANAYGGDYLFLDNEGGANAPGTLGRGDDGFQVWFTPLPVATEQWNTEAITTETDPDNDMRVIFRVLDAAGAGYNGEADLGKLCLTQLTIDKFDLSEMTEDSTVFSPADMQQATSADATKFSASGFDSNVSWTGNAITVTPKNATDGWTTELFKIEPGDTTADLNAGTGLADNWSITWEADTLYKVEVSMASSGATGETNPPDIIRVGMDSPTTEILALTQITPNMNQAGTPRNTAQTYTMFFYSHNVSVTERTGGYKMLRPRMDFICHPLLAAYNLKNTGGLKVNSMKVSKIVPAVQ